MSEATRSRRQELLASAGEVFRKACMVGIIVLASIIVIIEFILIVNDDLRENIRIPEIRMSSTHSTQ